MGCKFYFPTSGELKQKILSLDIFNGTPVLNWYFASYKMNCQAVKKNWINTLQREILEMTSYIKGVTVKEFSRLIVGMPT